MVSNIAFGWYQPEWKDCLKIFIWNTSINWCLYFRKVTLPFIFHPEFRKFSIKWLKPVVTQRVIAWSSESAFGPIRARIFCLQPMIEKLDFGPIRKKSAKYDDDAVHICSVVFNRHFECYVSYILLWNLLNTAYIQETGKRRFIILVCTHGKFSANGWQKTTTHNLIPIKPRCLPLHIF